MLARLRRYSFTPEVFKILQICSVPRIRTVVSSKTPHIEYLRIFGHHAPPWAPVTANLNMVLSVGLRRLKNLKSDLLDPEPQALLLHSGGFYYCTTPHSMRKPSVVFCRQNYHSFRDLKCLNLCLIQDERRLNFLRPGCRGQGGPWNAPSGRFSRSAVIIPPE